MASHALWMHECLTLAEYGRGKVGNGAMVGAVLVQENNIIAQGLHAAFGRSHAERSLLSSFTEPVPEGATLYVNLEPCCHHGKTPPCTDIILERGVKRVVFGMHDPDERVRGRGIELLRKAGVEVIGPVERARCEFFNRGFCSVRIHARPWIAMKAARMPDGRIAHPDGSPLQITDEEQNVWTHTFLRSHADAILVGVQTVIHDNPILDTRLARKNPQRKGMDQYYPYRIVLDPHVRIPLESRVATDEHRDRTILVTSPSIEAGKDDRKRILRERGMRVIDVPVFGSSFDLDELWRALLTPDGDYHGITSMLVEGGARTWEIFRKAGVVDEDVSLVGSGVRA